MIHIFVWPIVIAAFVVKNDLFKRIGITVKLTSDKQNARTSLFSVGIVNVHCRRGNMAIPTHSHRFLLDHVLFDSQDHFLGDRENTFR